MSQRKAKEYRRAMEQYQGVAADVDDLKRRIGAMEARHRREDRDKVAEMYRRRALAMERADLEMTKAAEKAERARRAERQRKNERRRQIIRRRRIATVVCLAALLVEESRLAESASLRLTHDQLARHLGSARGRYQDPGRGGPGRRRGPAGGRED